MKRRAVAFAVIAGACVLSAALYIAYAAARDRGLEPTSGTVAGQDAEALRSVLDEPYILFQSTAADGSFGRAAVVPLDDPAREPVITELVCDRVDMSGARGICLSSARAFAPTTAVVFDEELQPMYELGGPGIPSRTRVSPSGRWGAFTSFVSGHSYAEAGFSTRTVIVDLQERRDHGNLESFRTYRDGERIDAVDFNFWGVTFIDDAGSFYATLGTAGETYLVRGDVATRELEVVHAGVECPSLSPDGTRIAFKERVNAGALAPVEWRIAVLDLETGEVIRLAEERNVDDQVAWLDDETVMYGLPSADSAHPLGSDVWTVPADGTGEPTLLLPDAWSPRVVEVATG